MNGFYMSIGKQGCGKTVFITKLCIDNAENRPIFSNYSLFGIDYTPITLDASKNPNAISILDKLEENPRFFDNSIMLLDEIHTYFDSLDFMKSNSRKMHIFFSQLRKRNILLLATTQYLMNVDIRIRRQCFNIFEMEHIYKGLFKVTTHEIDGYFSREVSSYNIVLESYYKFYDTNELILE